MSWKGWSAFVVVSMLTVGCAQTDPGVTTAVKSKLAADDVVKAYRIDVDTKDHVVTLSGKVDTPEAHERAVQIAKNTNGVTNVVDQLIVSPGVTPTTGIDDPIQNKASDAAKDAKDAAENAGQKAGEKAESAKHKTESAADKAGTAMSDAAITAAVKTKFLADTKISGLSIDVDTKNGVVTLTGTLPSSAERTHAITVAKGTDGVKSVVNHLKVAPKK
jgi:hyperosmotically inducible protein